MEVITCGIPSCKAHEKENIYKIAVISLVLFLIGADQSFYDEESWAVKPSWLWSATKPAIVRSLFWTVLAAYVGALVTYFISCIPDTNDPLCRRRLYASRWSCRETCDRRIYSVADLVRFCLSGFAFVRPICRSGLHRQFVTILLLFRVYIVVNGN